MTRDEFVQAQDLAIVEKYEAVVTYLYRAAGEHERLDRFLAAWTGHASWADSRNLLESLGAAGGNLGRT